MSRATNTDTITVPRTANGTTYNILLRMEAHGYQLDVTLSNGRRRRMRTGTDDLAAAKAFAEGLDLEALDASATLLEESAANPTIRSMREWYIDTWMPNLNRKPGSIAGVESNLVEFELWLKRHHLGRYRDISMKVIEDYKAWLLREVKNGAKTTAMKVSDIRAMFTACREVDMVGESAIRRWILPEFDPPEIQSLEPHELAIVLQHVQEREPALAPPILWIAATGNRPSDARALRWDQIDLGTMTVRRRQEKTRNLAEYQIGPAALGVLERLPGPRTGTVFLHRGAPIAKNTLYNAMTRATKGTPYSWAGLKTLRHTFASILANQAGCPLPILQRLMGHSDIKMTMRYVRGGDAQPALHRYAELLKIPSPIDTPTTTP